MTGIRPNAVGGALGTVREKKREERGKEAGNGGKGWGWTDGKGTKDTGEKGMGGKRQERT